MFRRLNLTLLGGVAALTLAGCREDAPAAPEPLFVPASNAQAYDLPPLEPLAPPPAQSVSVAVPDYSYAERAYAMDRAFYDAPPDYGFSYMNAEPWAWRSTEGYEMYAEPIDDGYRYYYYEPGAEYPFFVRAPDYSYGYDSVGVVTVVYSSAGLIVPYAHRNRGFDYPDRYWRRAGDLRLAAHRHHAPVVRETWLERRPILVNSQRPWMKAAVEQRDWRRYREHDRDRELRRFDKERERRAEVVRRGRDHDQVKRMQVRHDEGRGRPLFEPPRGEPPRRGDRPQQQRPQQERKAERRDERPERQAGASRPDRPVMREERRSTRAQGAERGPQKVARAEQPRREVARPVRPQRSEQPQRSDRAERAGPAERPNRIERPNRSEGPSRVERNEARGQQARPQRVEPPQPQNRPERAAGERRPERSERPQDRQVARQERPARQEKAQRGGARQEARADRGGGQGRPDRQERGGGRN